MTTKPLPKHRPRNRYIHSTCGCWQCAYCQKIKERRERLAARIEAWDRANGGVDALCQSSNDPLTGEQRPV